MSEQGRQRRIRIHFFGRQPERPVCPLAGALGVGPMPLQQGTAHQRFDRLAQVARSAFEIVPEESADLWLYAHELSTPSEFHVQLRQLPSAAPRCVFFYGTDDLAPLQTTRPNVAIFRTSLFASTRLAHEYAMPALCDDLLQETAGQLIERPWSTIPSIGFCGFVGSPLKRLGFQLLRQRQKNDGLALRERVLNALERSDGIRTDFLRRSSFWGGAMSRFHFNSNLQSDVRTEFVQNLFRTDYGLCVRGKGNFSYRFYEVLSSGRIPVFVNTDCALPFERQVDWKRHAVWLEPDQLDTAAERVIRFHQTLGPAGFARLQHENRQLWKEWLSPESFFIRALESIELESAKC